MIKISTLENRLNQFAALCRQIKESGDEPTATAGPISGGVEGVGVMSLSQFLLGVDDLNLQEQLRVVETLRPFVAVVVRHLVVVPSHERRHFRMQALEVRSSRYCA